MRNTPGSEKRFGTMQARGFTLIELLTVIAIIGILAAILIPVVSRVRASARNAECITRLRYWGQAILMYAEENNGFYHIRRDWDATAASDPGLGEGESGTEGFGSAPWASATSDYNKYYLDLRRTAIQYRECPSANPGEPTYGIMWPTVNGVRPSVDNGVPIFAAVDPTGLMLVADTVPWDDATFMAIEGDLAPGRAVSLNGLSRDPYLDERHFGNINAVFADGHVSTSRWEEIEEHWDRHTSVR